MQTKAQLHIRCLRDFPGPVVGQLLGVPGQSCGWARLQPFWKESGAQALAAGVAGHIPASQLLCSHGNGHLCGWS